MNPVEMWLAVDWDAPGPALRALEGVARSVRPGGAARLAVAAGPLSEEQAGARLMELPHARGVLVPAQPGLHGKQGADVEGRHDPGNRPRPADLHPRALPRSRCRVATLAMGLSIKPFRSRAAVLAVAATAAGMLGLAPAAPGRALLVAGGTPELALVELSAGTVVARIPMPAPVAGVSTSPSGGRGYAAAGNTLVEIDIDRRAETRRVALPGAPVSQLVTARDRRLLALQGDRVTIVDPAALAPTATIALGAAGQQLSAGRAASRAAVVLAGGRVAILALDEGRVLRTVRVSAAAGAAIDGAGRTFVTAGRFLRVIPAGRRTVSRRARIRLPAGVGGAIAIAPRDARLAVGARAGGSGGAIVSPATGRVRRIVAGPGPGVPSWNLDATRVYVADGAGASISIVGAASGRRLDVVRLPGSRPFSAAEQRGLALLPGTDGSDTLTGTPGPDRMEGMAGADYLRGARGRDVVNGATGDDRLSGGAASDTVDGGEGDDFLAGGAGDDKLFAAAGHDGADGGTGNDTIEGGDGDDSLDGGDGDDTILGGPGDDRIVEKGFGNDKRLNGGPGDDRIEGGRGSDRIIEGEDGDDQLFGGPGKETISGGRGNDVVDGGRAADDLRGDEGDDDLRGDAGDDELDGADGADELDGGSGADRLTGDAGDDMITGGPGADVVAGGDGDDAIRAADDSADTVDCGDGNDTVFVEADTPQRDRLISCETVIPIPPEAANDTTAPSLFFGTV
ncbi:MAG TPA: calcium-binding protein, partial [Solirubrobacteraceae bacterium]|nr:calcium-binding protein [Solirubrobacteraceae bacterium]